MEHREPIRRRTSLMVLLMNCCLLSLSLVEADGAVAGAAAKETEPILVKSIAQLERAASAADPGDVVVLTDGTYDESCTLSARGREGRPIVIRAQTTGNVHIQNKVNVTGEYLSLVGFSFSHKGAVAIEGRGCRMSRCHMSNVQAGKWVVVAAGSRNIEIDHCLFENKENNRELERGCQLIQLTVLNKKERHHVHHNHFRDIPKGAGNGFETLQLITENNPKDPARGHCETVIEDNLFERCNGEAEIISIKSNGNMIRRNTFRACHGALVFRHGDENTAIHNFFFGNSGGVRLQGTDQAVVYNYFDGLGFGVSVMDGSKDDLYVRVERANILFNTFVNCRNALLVGMNHSKYPNGRTPKDCLIAGNIFYSPLYGSAGQIIMLVNDDQPENWRWIDNIAYGALGISAVEGIRTNNPHLRLQPGGMALPSSDTPSTKQLAGESEKIIVDILGEPLRRPRTLGAVEFPLKTGVPRPLSAKQVGPQAVETSSD